MGAAILQVIPQLWCKLFKKSLFISANTYEKYIVSKEYCIFRHDDKMCFLPNCRCHIILIGNIKDLVHKLDAFCFIYQHVDCLYTLFNYNFSGKFVVKSGQLFDTCRGQFFSTSKTEEGTECPASRKRGSWEKNTKNFCWAPSKRPSRRKQVDQCLQTELNKLKRLNLN